MMAGLQSDYIDLKYNHRRRLRNALLALAQLDPGWMVWVEREVNPRWSLERVMRLVEARARILTLRHYGPLAKPGNYFSDMHFSDSGALRQA